MHKIPVLLFSLSFLYLVGCSEAVVNINVNSKKPLPSAGPGFSSGSPRVILESGSYKLAVQVQSESQTVLSNSTYTLKVNPVVIE